MIRKTVPTIFRRRTNIMRVIGIIIIVTMVLLSGCATTPQLPRVADVPAEEVIPVPAEYIYWVDMISSALSPSVIRNLPA